MSVLCMLCEQEPATIFAGMGGEYCWCAMCYALSDEEQQLRYAAQLRERETEWAAAVHPDPRHAALSWYNLPLDAVPTLAQLEAMPDEEVRRRKDYNISLSRQSTLRLHNDGGSP